MEQQFINISETTPVNEVDLYRLMLTLWKRRNILFLFSSIAALVSLFVALFWFSNIYTSSTVLMPKNSSTTASLASTLGLPEMGGLSMIPGLGGGSADPNIHLAKKLITARGFVINFVRSHNYLPEIMVAKDWKASSNSIIYDNKGYDIEGDKLTFTPSDEDIYKSFMNGLSLTTDRETQFITIDYNHFSPYFAQEILKVLTIEINKEVRNREIKRTKKSIDYLNIQIESTSIVDLKQLFIGLREANIKNLMLAEIDEYYVLDIVDAPIFPSQKTSPRRTLICVFGTFFGACFGLFFIVMLRFFKYDLMFSLKPLQFKFIPLNNS